MNIATEPPSLDPRRANDITSANVLNMLYEGLYRMGPDNTPQPALAQSVTISNDLRTYTFQLRPSLWSNGSPLTAHDFVYTLRSTLSPSFPSGSHCHQLYPIKNAREVKLGTLPPEALGVRALDDFTLEISLLYPSSHFIELTTSHMYYPIPQHVEEEDPSWWQTGKSYVSNGPFTIKQWRPFQLLQLERSSSFWDSTRVQFEEIELTMLEDPHTELALFEQGVLDWAGQPFTFLPADAIEDLSLSSTFYEQPVAAVYWYKLNTRHPLLKNKKIRQALSLAIDRESIIQHITHTRHAPATCFLPPQAHPLRPLFHDKDPKLARQLFDEGLKELGFSRGDTLPPLVLSYNTGMEHHRIAQAIQQQWNNALDITVLLENSEWSVHLDKLHTHNYDISRIAWFLDYTGPMALLELFALPNAEGGSNNDTYWHDPAYTALLDQARYTIDPLQRMRLFEEAEEILADAMPAIPLFFLSHASLRSHALEDIFIGPLGRIECSWGTRKEALY